MAIAQHKTRRRELREGRALARRVQRGDRKAFELLYASYEGRLYRFCHRLTGSDAAAASLVEATFVRGARDAAGGRARRARRPGPPLGDRARPRLRAAHERRRCAGSIPFAGEHAREVGAANQRLSPRQRMTLALRDLEGRPDDEIALALGADAATVAALVARARLRLRDELELPEPRGRLPRPPTGALGLRRRHPAGRSPRRARDARRRMRRLPRRALRPAGGGAALPLAARPRAPGRAAVAHHGRARRGRLPHAAAARAHARSRARRRGPPDGSRSRDGGARRRRGRRHDPRLAQ